MLIDDIAKEVFDFYGVEDSKIPNKSTVVINGEDVELTDELLQEILAQYDPFDFDNCTENNICEGISYTVSFDNSKFAGVKNELSLAA